MRRHDLTATTLPIKTCCSSLQTQQVTKALLGHKDRVTCVHWLPYEQGSGSLTLVSGSVDGDIVLWAVTKKTNTVLDQLSQRGERLHSGTVNHICSFPASDGRSSAVVCSVAADSQCIMWQVSKAAGKAASLVLQQQLGLSCMQMSAELSFVPGHPDWCGLHEHYYVLFRTVNFLQQQCNVHGHHCDTTLNSKADVCLL